MINIELKDSIKIKDDKSLFVSFKYDQQTVDTIKQLNSKDRVYHFNTKCWEISRQSIQELIKLFGKENLNIYPNVDLNYIKEELVIDETNSNNEKWQYFIPILKKMPVDIANFTIEVLKQVPDYFWEVSASSSGKHHPQYALNEGGLCRHTMAACLIGLELYNNETITGHFSNREKALMLAGTILHDTFKQGENGGKYALEHPILASNFIKQLQQDFISKDEVYIIADSILTHMGEWTKSFNGKEVLEKPKTEMQKFVHLMDFLASRKILEVNFDVVG